MFKEEFDVLVGNCDQVGADESHEDKQDARLVGVHLVHAPEQP